MKAVAAKMVIGALRAYQAVVSPWLPAACRYSPTCSQYAIEAVRRYGATRGLWIAARRLARCHPFHAGGYDPVR
ncbi:MAG: membrane protein insertion efficiency factor YidD [Terriglobales bacterium]